MHLEARDTKNSYSYRHAPVATVSAGSRFTIDTLDCFGGRLENPEDYTQENIEWVEGNLNPLTGPIEIQGTRAGQVVRVDIESIVITTDARFVRSRYEAHSPQDWWHEEFAFVSYEVLGGYMDVRGHAVEVAPIIGCLGTAPGNEELASPKQGTFGGNLDCSLVTRGASITLPAFVDGGFLYFGDVKAAMGDGEIVNAAEAGSRITATVSVLERPEEMVWPRVENGDGRAVLVSNRSLSDAARTAFREMVDWVSANSTAPRGVVIQVLGLVADLGICQVSNPLFTAHCYVRHDKIESLLS